MASTKAYPASPSENKDWQAEDDHRSLSRAAEVMADKIRYKKAMACMKSTHATEGKMIQVLSGMRLTKK